MKDRAILLRRLCELNAREQVQNVANTTTIQDAWRRGQAITIHGWICDIHDGLIRDLGVSVSKMKKIASKARNADSPRRGIKQR